MNEREFRRLMLAYGADIRRWPIGRQDAAEKWQSAHPESRPELRQMAEMDRLLRDVAPQIERARIDRAVDSLLLDRARISRSQNYWRLFQRSFDWPRWRWAPRGAVYLGLFILGCAANLAVRLLAAETPLDLWFSGNLSLPLGG